jgi:hypothetical protein
MFKSPIVVSSLFVALAVSSQATASEDDDKLAGIKCFPAKQIVKIVNKFAEMKPEHTDTVKSEPEMNLEVLDDGVLPEKVYYRLDGDETEFQLAENGAVTDFGKIGGLSKKGEMCIQDKTRVDAEEGEDRFSLGVKFDVRFQNKTGPYLIAELKDGLDDGKRHYKKLVPGPVKLLMPSMTHVGVTFLDDEDAPNPLNKVVARKGDQILDGLMVEDFAGMSMVEVAHLEDLGADTLVIEGSPFNMMPLASVEKLKKFGFADEDEQDVSTKDTE